MIDRHTRQLLVACGFLTLSLSACGGEGGAMNNPRTPKPATNTEHNIAVNPTPVLPVRVIVMRNNEGLGNTIWTSEWLDYILGEAEGLLHNRVMLALAGLEYHHSTTDYQLEQAPLYAKYRTQGTPGILTLVISHPFTEDSAGLTDIRGGSAPVIVMRARGFGRESVKEVAAILLHELGHVLGLSHEPNPFFGDWLTTENYAESEDGIQLLLDYITLLSRGSHV